MNRIDRVSAILIQLQSRSTIKAQQIAERFDISLRTVYRDIRTLEEAGIPIIGNPGIGYSLVAGYKLPPLMFTQAEALAFMTAEKLVNELTDSGSSEHYRSGMDKIKAVLRFADKDVLENIEASFGIMKTYRSKISDSGNTIQILLNSIEKRRILRITYFSDYKQKVSQREIEPVGIFFSRINWYLIAFCHTRNEYRTFKLNRIQEMSESGETFTKEHPSLNDFLEDTRKKEDLKEVVIRLKKNNISILGDDKYYHGLFSEIENGEYVELSFLTFSLEKFARWYLSFADTATIIQPDSLITEVRNILNRISI